MRKGLYEALVRLKTPGDWSHIIKQTGMFGYTGISPKQIAHLRGKCNIPFDFGSLLIILTEKYSIYMADTSRISIAGLTEANIEYVATAIDEAVRTII